jgi:hypothetical protein
VLESPLNGGCDGHLGLLHCRGTGSGISPLACPYPSHGQGAIEAIVKDCNNDLCLSVADGSISAAYE